MPTKVPRSGCHFFLLSTFSSRVGIVTGIYVDEIEWEVAKIKILDAEAVQTKKRPAFRTKQLLFAGLIF